MAPWWSKSPGANISIMVFGGFSLFLFVCLVNKHQSTAQYSELGNKQNKLRATIELLFHQKADILNEIATAQMRLDEVE